LIIDKKIVKKILDLSALELTDKDAEILAVQLSSILQHMKVLEGVDTKNVNPMFFGCEEEASTREDKVEVFDADLIKKENPYIEKGNFSVPNIIVGEE